MLKVEELSPKLQDKIITLKAQGYSNQAVADLINNEFETDLTKHEIVSYFRKRRDKSIEVLRKDKKLQKKLAERYFNTIEQINILNHEMWEFWYSLKKSPETSFKRLKCPKCGKEISIEERNYKTLLKAAEQILKQIEHVDKVIGRLKKENLTINIDTVDLSKNLSVVIPRLLERLEKQDIIKIKKKRLIQDYK